MNARFVESLLEMNPNLRGLDDHEEESKKKKKRDPSAPIFDALPKEKREREENKKKSLGNRRRGAGSGTRRGRQKRNFQRELNWVPKDDK